MSSQQPGPEGGVINRVESTISPSSVVPPISPYMEIQKKAKAQFNEFTAMYRSEERSIDPEFDHTVERSIATIIDPVVQTEIKRITDFSGVKQSTSLESFIDNTASEMSSASLISAVKSLSPSQPEEKAELLNDVMRVRATRVFSKAKNASIPPLYPLSKDTVEPQFEALLSVNDEATIRKYCGEMERFGIDGIDTYYSALSDIHLSQKTFKATHKRAQSCSDIDSTAHYAIQSIRNMELPDEEKIILERGILAHAKTKRDSIRQYSTEGLGMNKDVIQKKIKDIQEAPDFGKLVDEAWETLQYNTPKKDKTFLLNHAPKPIMDLLILLKEMRAGMSKHGVTPELVARYGWQLRLRPDQLAIILEKFGKYADAPDFRRFASRVQDEYLRTEASGFEIRENVKMKDGVSNEALLRESMNALLKVHRPRGQQKVYFTLFYGENSMQKVAVDTYEDITSVELDRNIAEALKLAKTEAISLTLTERAALGFTRYSLNREKDETYKKIYHHGEQNDIKGDYVIQIKDHTTASSYSEDTVDEHSPTTLFAAADGQLALLLDRRQMLKRNVESMRTVIRYTHSKKDGGPAYIHSQKIFKALRDLKGNRYTTLDTGLSTYIDHEVETGIEADTIGVPQLEGRSFYKEIDESYPSLHFTVRSKTGEEKQVKLSPAFTRSLIYALANNVDVFHYLHAASKDGDIYFDEKGDQFDSLQPLYTSFNHLKDEFNTYLRASNKQPNPEVVIEWLRSYEGQKQRAERGFCDLFTLASAPPGKVELPFANASKKVHGGAALLTSPSGGMYSGLSLQPESEARTEVDVDKKHIFDTYFSSAEATIYNRIPIDLQNARPCMGIIGYLQRGDVAVSTCRKLPCQAQETFKTEFLKLTTEELTGKKQASFLKQFHPLLEKWDELVKGSATLSEYIDARTSLFEKLTDEDAPTREILISLGCTNQVEFQAYLNRILQKSADETLDRNKIIHTKEAFIGFMHASGVKTAMKEKKSSH